MQFVGIKSNLELSYNLLNLPDAVSQAGSEKATYSWFADGSKFKVLSPEGDGYCYIGSLIYASNEGTLQIESTAFAGGRINLATSTGGAITQDIQYHHTDHLGSVRAITNQSGETVEQNAYYPFGSRHTFGNTYAQTTNRFKYNGKEEQTTGNLQYLDYGARMYDSKIARWFVQDPLSEKYYAHSPYNYCVNNPVMFVDPDGRKIIIGKSIKIFSFYICFDSYEKSVTSHLSSLKKISSELKDAIKSLEESEFTIEIVHTKNRDDGKTGNAFKKVSYKTDKEGRMPSGGILYYDPNNYKTNLGNTRDPIVGLAHELGHALNAIKGENVIYSIELAKANDPINMQLGNEDERRSIYFENIIRALLCMETRSYDYYKKED